MSLHIGSAGAASGPLGRDLRNALMKHGDIFLRWLSLHRDSIDALDFVVCTPTWGEETSPRSDFDRLLRGVLLPAIRGLAPGAKAGLFFERDLIAPLSVFFDPPVAEHISHLSLVLDHPVSGPTRAGAYRRQETRWGFRCRYIPVMGSRSQGTHRALPGSESTFNRRQVGQRNSAVVCLRCRSWERAGGGSYSGARTQ